MRPAPPRGSRSSWQLVAVLTAGAALLLSGCLAALSPEPGPTASSAPTSTPVVIDTSTIRTIIDSPRTTSTLDTHGAAEQIAGETATAVSYDSGGVTVTGVLRIPDGEGPHPVVVVVHGSVDPDRYETGRDLVPEQRALLEGGYAVLATDLRGYAGSDPADSESSVVVETGFGWPTVLDWGMALDVVTALEVMRSGQVEGIDADRVGLLGHSLGGLLSLDAAVIAPGAADLVIAMSAPPSDMAAVVAAAAARDDGFEEQLSESGMSAVQNPEYWADVSPASFFERATEPLLLLHGTADDVAPVEGAQQTSDAWTAAGGTAEIVILDGGDHHLEPRRDEADGVIVAAFDAVLR